MDLFNPPPTLNYLHMTHDLDLSKLDNPYIQVVWEDFAENFTQEKIKSVRQYFQKKYQSTNINVITKTKTVANNDKLATTSQQVCSKLN